MPTFTVEVTDLEYKILEYAYGDPGVHIDKMVTNRANIGIKELAEYEIRRRHEDSTWTAPIPAEYELILSEMEIKSQKEMLVANEEYTRKLVEDPDYGLTHTPPSAFYPKEK